MTESIHWIAVDWGTTHLRTYAMSDSHTVIAEAQSSNGMGALKTNEFEAALLALVSEWLPSTGKILVLACGMVGARQGWVEAAYRNVPCALLSGIKLTLVKTDDDRLDVRILPGLCQSAPADVMRGEETQIAGLLAEKGEGITTVCLPGTHSKWATLEKGHIQSFSTFMTGELFALFSTHSILRHSVNTAEWDEEVFLLAVKESMEQPEMLLSNSFRIRAQGLLGETTGAKARLSGLLIGSELAGAKHYWAQHSVALIGDTALSELYEKALHSLAVETQHYDPKDMTVAGLRQQAQNIF
jgi:2-dehydro-3-deoxygalactonokinase